MKILQLLLFFLFTFPCAGIEKKANHFGDFERKQEVIYNDNKNYPIRAQYSIMPKVNVITGEYFEQECDLVVSGVEPLSFRRFYGHFAFHHPDYNFWRFNPEHVCVANFEWGEQECFLVYGERDGSFSRFEKSFSNTFKFNPHKEVSFTHAEQTGQTHPMNAKISYHRFEERYRNFRWEAEIVDGSGAKKICRSESHDWLSGMRLYEYPHIPEGPYTITPNVWTPYDAPVYEERRPNGNYICYSYQAAPSYDGYPTYLILRSVTAYNSSKTKILGSLSIDYRHEGKGRKCYNIMGMTVTGSDARKAVLNYKRIDITENGEYCKFLHSVSSPCQPTVHYQNQGRYLSESLKRINGVERPDGRALKTFYNKERKVERQEAPVGPNGEMCSIGQYTYHANSTDVFNAEGHKTTYHYNDEKKITRVEKFQEGKLYLQEQMQWNKENGNLISKKILDGQGKLFLFQEFHYDKNHNVIEETIGDERDCYTLYRTFSDDGFNLKLTETNQNGKRVKYEYVPNTNLLAKECIFDHEKIYKRQFFFYDDCAALIKTIVDDGTSEDPSDLQAVSYRKILEIKPKQSLPCFGLPEIVEKKTINSQGEEIFLERIEYCYTPFGKVARENHYNGEGQSYSIINQYDGSERLVSTTDFMSYTTTFAYDANHNLTSIQGPREDQRKQIIYDKVNRPIKEIEWQSDSTSLVREKFYNKLGLLIREKDESGFETRYEYDVLGRVVAIHYPDGGIIRKEYDILGNVLKQTDPNGYATVKTYNFRGKPLSIIHPDGSVEYFTYHPNGNLETHIDKNGAKTVYSYDIFDNPVKMETFSSSSNLLKTVSATYSSFHQLSVTDGEGVSTFYSYDFAGRKIAIQKGEKKTFFSYDSLSRLIKVMEGETVTINEYDLNGRIVEEKVENITGKIQKKVGYAYDAAGNRTKIYTFDGVRECLYNSRGELIFKKDPLGNVSTIDYSYPGGVVKTETNPKKIQTVHIYNSRGIEIVTLKKNPQDEIIQKVEKELDKNGNPIKEIHTVYEQTTPIKTITHTRIFGPGNRLEKLIEAGEKETLYLYDEKGRQNVIVKPNGTKLFSEYDDLGRLCRYHSSDFDYRYGYDRKDQLLFVMDMVSNYATARLYDPLGNMTYEILGNGLGIYNDFDAQGKRVTMTLPDASTIHFSYEGNFLHQVQRHHYIHTYAKRNLNGLLTEAALVENLGSITIERDPLGRWKEYKTPFFKSTFPEDAYDGNGNLIHHSFEDPLGHEEYFYSYDDLDQLISEKDHSYHFDSIHNRSEKDEVKQEFNALCQNTRYSYDINGNLLSYEGFEMTYDTQDRLIKAKKEELEILYTYDSVHRRLSKKVLKKGKLQEERYYIWDGDNEIGSTNKKGKIKELRVLGEGLGAEMGAAVLLELEGRTYVSIHDHRGSVVNLIDLKKKQPKETYRYTAFGEQLTDGKFCPWRFVSKRIDDELNFVYFRYRYYLPTLGMWTTPDPQGFVDGPNLYAYLHNCPLMFCDYYGLWSNPFAGTHNFIEGVGRLSHYAFRSIELIGQHLIPVPLVRDAVESVGRWGRGGNFFDQCEYQKNYSRIHTIPGKQEGKTLQYGNGLLVPFDEAVQDTQDIANKFFDGIEATLFYRGTKGLITDLLCGLFSKNGSSSLAHMEAEYYHKKLAEDPNHRFLTYVHSNGSTHLMNASKIMGEEICMHIDVVTLGGSTIIPKGIFASAKNHVSLLDFVPWSSPIYMGMAMINKNVEFHAPASLNPLKEHCLRGQTYWRVIENEARDFQLVQNR